MKRLSSNVVPILANLFAIIAGAYGLSISGFLVLRALFGERWWPIGLFDSFAHLLMLPALPLIVASLLVRKRWALAQAIPAFAFLAAYGGVFFTSPVSAKPGAPQIRILTFNLNKANQSLDQVIQIIQDSGADMVAFQELNPFIADGLKARLSHPYPYNALHPDLENSFRGVGFISRYPILSDDFWPNIGLGHQRLELDVNGTTLVVHNTHPMHPLRGIGYDKLSRAEAVTQILERVSADSGAVLLLGDFNMTDQAADYARITAHLQDTYRQVGRGMGFTFPDFKVAFGIAFLPPLARIDYVFHNQAFQALEARVWPESGGSDHRPLFARLEMNDGMQ